MIINNMGGGIIQQSQLSLMQSELVKASVEYTKQRGVMKELIKELARKKVKALYDMYGGTTVYHEKYGVCKWEFVSNIETECLTIRFQYWVKSIQTANLSKTDKKVAECYNSAYNYNCAVDRASNFKSFDDMYQIYSSIEFVFTVEDMANPNFLKAGILADGDFSPFTINLKKKI